MKQVILLFLAILALSHSSISQVPHEWYMGNGEVIKFSMDGLELAQDTAVSDRFHNTEFFQILDSSDSFSEILFNKYVWKKEGENFKKERLKSVYPLYRTKAVLNDVRFVQKLDSNSTQILIIQFDDGTHLLIDSFIPSKIFYISSPELVQNSSGDYNLYFTSYRNDLKFYLNSYQFDRNGLKSKKELNLMKELNRDLNFEGGGNGIIQLSSKLLLLTINGYYDTLDRGRSINIQYFAHVTDDGSLRFEHYKTDKGSKRKRLDGSVFDWGLPMNMMYFLNTSINDSILIGLKPYYTWTKEKDRDGKEYKREVFNQTIRIFRYSTDSIKLIDSSDLISTSNISYYIPRHSFYSCNSNLYVYYNGKGNKPTKRNHYLMSFSNDIQKLNIKPTVEITQIDLDTNIYYYYIPRTNNSHKRIEFRKGRQCSPQLRLFAFADSYYDSFEWHIANDTGGYDIRHGKKLLYDAPGKEKFYVTLKGIHKETGYFAWYSDSIDFTTGPKASFAADTNKWCQYVELQMKNTTQTGEITDEQALWRIYHDGELERTYKQKNPKITFTKTGKYDIELHYSNGGCKDSVRQSGFIEIIEAPKPGFVTNDSLFCTPDILQVSDRSEGRITKKYYVFNKIDTIHQAGFEKAINWPGHYYSIEQKLEGPTGCVTHQHQVVRSIKGFTRQDKPIALTVNVLDSQSTELKWLPLPNNKTQVIYRDQVKLMDSLNASDSVYYDYTPSTAQQTYVYHLKANDSCGHSSDFSNPVSTVLLQSENINNEYVNLSWSAFKSWPVGVDYYTLEISKDGQNWESFESTSALELSTSVDETNVDQTIHYRIIAQEKEGYRQTAISNVVSEKLLPTIFIPNAFSPNSDGMNEEFSAQGFGLDSVELQVFARSGQRLFSSSQGENSWDGYVNGEKQPTGIYYYIIKAITTTGKEIRKNGLVHLIGD